MPMMRMSCHERLKPRSGRDVGVILAHRRHYRG
jgi:hypothetical protein